MIGTCVIYLVWGPLGPGPLERFAASYRAHPAGLAHELVLVMKGVSDVSLRERCRAFARELAAERLELEASGLDLDTYLEAAKRLHAARLCFLNSSSEILADRWLGALASALDCRNVGLAGATGSYESALSAGPRPLKLLLRRQYPPFPNPHLRTNAFMIEQELMLTLDWPSSHRKRRALELESGRRSITRQVLARGLDAVVVGSDGLAYAPELWPTSCTFRSGAQENLLVADNRTRQYMEADAHRRRQLESFAWGATALSPQLPAPASRR